MEQKDLLVSLFKLCLNDTEPTQTRGSGPQSMAPSELLWIKNYLSQSFFISDCCKLNHESWSHLNIHRFCVRSPLVHLGQLQLFCVFSVCMFCVLFCWFLTTTTTTTTFVPLLCLFSRLLLHSGNILYACNQLKHLGTSSQRVMLRNEFIENHKREATGPDYDWMVHASNFARLEARVQAHTNWHLPVSKIIDPLSNVATRDSNNCFVLHLYHFNFLKQTSHHVELSHQLWELTCN